MEPTKPPEISPYILAVEGDLAAAGYSTASTTASTNKKKRKHPPSSSCLPLPPLPALYNSTGDSKSTTVTLNAACPSILVTGSARLCVQSGAITVLGCSVEEQQNVLLRCGRSGYGHAQIVHLLHLTSTATIEFDSLTDAGEKSFQLFDPDSYSSHSDIPIIQINSSWEATSNKIIAKAQQRIEQQIRPRVTLVSGAKGVGKSTFLRYHLNQCLSFSSKVAVLDCDVGQPEFGVPGVLTLSFREEGVLGPPPEYMGLGCGPEDKAYFFGDITSKFDPMRYTSMVSSLFQHYLSLPSPLPPLIVNTDGWVKSMGHDILLSIIDIVDPSDIVQIIGTTKAKMFNLEGAVKTGREMHIVETFSGSDSSSNSNNINSSSNSNNNSNSNSNSNSNVASASELRNLRICAYFLSGIDFFNECGASFHTKLGVVDPKCKIAKRLSAMPVLKVSTSALSISILPEDSEPPSLDKIYKTIENNIVALCSGNNNEFVGLGLVRSIDNVEHVLSILTPVSRETLKTRNVNVLVAGRIFLPVVCCNWGEAGSFEYLDDSPLAVERGGKPLGGMGDRSSSPLGDTVMRSRNNL